MKTVRKLSDKKRKNSRARHVLKTISWRAVGSIDTYFMAYIVGNHSLDAGKIAFTEIISKMILYYFHERVWYRLAYGIKNGNVMHQRHIAKAISWRVLGTLDTVIISWIIFGDITKGLSVGALELFTKTLLYYLHERAWLQINLKWFQSEGGR